MKNYLSFILFSVLLTIVSCSKDTNLDKDLGNAVLSQTANFTDPFLSDSYARSVNNYICKPVGDTSNTFVRQQVKNQLNMIKSIKPNALLSLSTTFGYPVWDACLTGAGSNGNNWYLIPLIAKNEQRTSSIMLVNQLSSQTFELNFYKRFDILMHIKKNNSSNIDVYADIYDLFTICDYSLFCNVIGDSISLNIETSNFASRNNLLITITWAREGTKDDCRNCDPHNMSYPSFVTESKTVFAGCGGGGGVSTGGGSSNGQGGVFWGGNTGIGGGADGNSTGGPGGGGSNPNPFGLNCIPNFEVIDYFELLSELEQLISTKNLSFSAYDIIEYISPSCLDDPLNFEQCVLDHLRCLGISTGNILGLSESEIQTFIKDPFTTVLPAVFFLKDENYNQDAKEYINGVVSLIAKDELLKMERFIEVYYLFLDDPDFLIRDCLENHNPNEVDFTDLYHFVPPPNVLARLDDLGEGWRLQPLETPSSSPSINLDYFSVIIDQMPINPSTGVAWTHDDFFSYMRKNINHFVNSTWAEFNPFSPEDDAIWLSSNPVTAVISINIFGPDNGSVICAQNQSCCWIFSTVKTPNLSGFDGYHPVSGNRQFGYNILNNGSMEIYVKGVDRFLMAEFIGGSIHPMENRPEKLLVYLAEKVAFTAADQLWKSFQNGVKSYVEKPTHQGSARVMNPILIRPRVSQQLIDILRSNNKIEFVPCGN